MRVFSVYTATKIRNNYKLQMINHKNRKIRPLVPQFKIQNSHPHHYGCKDNFFSYIIKILYLHSYKNFF